MAPSQKKYRILQSHLDLGSTKEMDLPVTNNELRVYALEFLGPQKHLRVQCFPNFSIP